jgi:hypothetical protein
VPLACRRAVQLSLRSRKPCDSSLPIYRTPPDIPWCVRVGHSPHDTTAPSGEERESLRSMSVSQLVWPRTPILHRAEASSAVESAPTERLFDYLDASNKCRLHGSALAATLRESAQC